MSQLHLDPRFVQQRNELILWTGRRAKEVQLFISRRRDAELDEGETDGIDKRRDGEEKLNKVDTTLSFALVIAKERNGVSFRRR